MKKLIVFIIVLLLVGCTSKLPDPDEVTILYLESLRDGEIETAYQYLTADEADKKSLAEFKEEHSNQLLRYFRGIISFEIKDITENRGSANVVITRSYPDLSHILPEILGTPMMQYLHDSTAARELYQKLTEKYKDQNIPTLQIDESYRLVKESSGWKIHPIPEQIK